MTTRATHAGDGRGRGDVVVTHPEDEAARPLRHDGATPTVLIVDDDPASIARIEPWLRSVGRVKVARDARNALRIVSGSDVDLIVMDVVMPGMNGIEVCRRLKDEPQHRHVPVLFHTQRTDPATETRALAAGADDVVAKPVDRDVLVARVRRALERKAAFEALAERNAALHIDIERRVAEARDIQDVTVVALASLAETRDEETGNHVRRTQAYVQTLAKRLRMQARFAFLRDPETLDAVSKAAALHDVGKVGIADRILRKPGALTTEEFEVMKTHTILGFEALDRAERSLGHPVPFLTFAKEIALHHQERWDGSGYPDGLAGDEIPLSARLMAVADVYDALISKRVYKPAMPHEEAVRFIVEHRGVHFDPLVVDAMLETQSAFREITRRFADDDPPVTPPDDRSTAR